MSLEVRNVNSAEVESIIKKWKTKANRIKPLSNPYLDSAKEFFSNYKNDPDFKHYLGYLVCYYLRKAQTILIYHDRKNGDKSITIEYVCTNPGSLDYSNKERSSGGATLCIENLKKKVSTLGFEYINASANIESTSFFVKMGFLPVDSLPPRVSYKIPIKRIAAINPYSPTKKIKLKKYF